MYVRDGLYLSIGSDKHKSSGEQATVRLTASSTPFSYDNMR